MTPAAAHQEITNEFRQLNRKQYALQAIFHYCPLTPRTTRTHNPPLMIKVAQHNEYPSIFRSKHILYRDFYIIECDECCTCCRRISRLDRFRLDAFLAFDKKDGETLASIACNGEIVTERPICDPPMEEQISMLPHEIPKNGKGDKEIGYPLFSPIDNEMFPILRLFSSTLQSRHITSSKRLRDSERDELLAGKNIRYNFRLKFWAAKIHDGR